MRQGEEGRGWIATWDRCPRNLESGQYRTVRRHLVFWGTGTQPSALGGQEARLTDTSAETLTLADLTDRAVRLAPGRIAVITPGARYTFVELNEAVRRAAAGFKALGLTPRDRIALLLPNSIEYLHAFHAIPVLGAVGVPINTFLAAAEIATVLEDSGARCLITTGKRLSSLGPHLAHLSALAAVVVVPCENGSPVNLPTQVRRVEWSEIAATPPLAPGETRPSPGDVAMLTYTSGTTGKMKGVKLSHANLIANARSCLAAVKLRESDRLLLFLPMFHSLTQLVCLVVPALAGLSIVLLPGVDRAAIARALRRHRPTIFLAVPAVYAAMAERPPGFFKRILNPVRLYISGAAPLSTEVLGRFETGWRRPLCEGYGLSEAAPVVCLNPVDGERKPGSVGPPIPGVEVRIVDDTGAAAAPGAIGEIVVRGANVMIGYHERPEETAAALRDGWLHTGDLGRLDDDGYLFIVGRRKEMLIFRGMNIYPREIEEVLATHPAVDEAAVVGLSDARAGETPHAVVVLRAGAATGEKELRAYCLSRLARYKVPRTIQIADALPRNATGKVLKDRIRDEMEKSKALSKVTPRAEPDPRDA